MSLQITEQFVQQVSPPPIKPDGKGTQAFYRDSKMTGFGLRVASGGTKSFIVEKRIKGKVRRITLGRYGKLSVAQARAEAEKLLLEIRQVNRPKIVKGRVTAPDIKLMDAYEDYISSHTQLKKSTLQDYQRSIDGPLHDWLTWPLAKISPGLVLSLHNMYGSQSRARINNAMRLLRAIFNHAIQHYINETGQALFTLNPVEVLNSEQAWYNIKPRQSHLSGENLPHWWRATMKLKSEAARDFLHFLLFSGLTRSIAYKLTFDDIDFERKLIHINKSKNEDNFILPMNDFINTLIRRRAWARPGTRGYIFPGIKPDTPLSEPRSAVKRVGEITGSHFSLYDLRRTYLHFASLQGLQDIEKQPRLLKFSANKEDLDSEATESARKEQEQICQQLSKLTSQ